MRWHKYILLLFMMFCSVVIIAQRSVKKQADKYYKAGKYYEALVLYNDLENLEKDYGRLLKRGICFYYIQRPKAALKDLNKVLLDKEKDFPREALLYTAKSYHASSEYEKAAFFYKRYLATSNKRDKERAKVISYIKKCEFGLRTEYDDQIAFVENPGTSVNSRFNEIHPVQSPNHQNKYYFSSDRQGSTGGLRSSEGQKDEKYGKYAYDMYAVSLQSGNWASVSSIDPLLNSPENDMVLDFKSDGSVMYFMRSKDMTSGAILTDTFTTDRDLASPPEKLVSPVISDLGDNYFRFCNDSTVIFSSKRKGGYGGYDLYITDYKDGMWTEPLNLGPEVNSEYDEISPYLTKNGTTLFFSSDRINGLGGFDIFSVSYDAKKRIWKKERNLGKPINSPGNDICFSLSSDGITGIFSSDRPGSLGGYDLFIAYLTNQEKGQFARTKEIPFLTHLRTESQITIEDNQVSDNTAVSDQTKENMISREVVLTPFYYNDDENILNPLNVKQITDLTDLSFIFPEIKIVLFGNSTRDRMPEYDLYFSIKRAEKIAEQIVERGVEADRVHVIGLGSNYPIVKTLDGNQVSPMALKHNRRIDVLITNTENTALKIVQNKAHVAAYLKDERSDAYLEKSKDLSFKVHIAATRQMYKSELLNTYETVSVEKNMAGEDYIYSVGIFDTYAEARSLKNELIQKDVTNAKIVPYMDGLPILKGIESLSQKFSELANYLRYEAE